MSIYDELLARLAKAEAEVVRLRKELSAAENRAARAEEAEARWQEAFDEARGEPRLKWWET